MFQFQDIDKYKMSSGLQVSVVTSCLLMNSPQTVNSGTWGDDL